MVSRKKQTTRHLRSAHSSLAVFTSPVNISPRLFSQTVSYHAPPRPPSSLSGSNFGTVSLPLSNFLFKVVSFSYFYSHSFLLFLCPRCIITLFILSCQGFPSFDLSALLFCSPYFPVSHCLPFFIFHLTHLHSRSLSHIIFHHIFSLLRCWQELPRLDRNLGVNALKWTVTTSGQMNQLKKKTGLCDVMLAILRQMRVSSVLSIFSRTRQAKTAPESLSTAFHYRGGKWKSEIAQEDGISYLLEPRRG